ncbi:hypothetical protein ACOMHN_040687 [Nucella lapillus]
MNIGIEAQKSPQHIHLELQTNSSFKLDTVRCPEGHYTHAFLACDVEAICFSNQDWSYTSLKESWDVPSSSTCPVSQLQSLPPSFLCATVPQRVPYSLVCDHRRDCQDNSDEFFCHFPPCPLSMLRCGNLKQCYTVEEECNGIHDCLNGFDEVQCLDDQLNALGFSPTPIIQPYSPFVVSLDGQGKYKLESLHDQPCPVTHFWCLSNEYCLPVYLRCNGINDCPEREDEQGCNLN